MKRILILWLCLCGAANATTWIASNTGTDGGAGTLGDPFSLPKACTASAISSGDTVRMRGGVYPAKANFGGAQYSWLMSPKSDVTYRSYGGEWAVLRGDDDWTGWTDSGVLISTIVAGSTSNVTLDSFEIRWGAKFGIGCFGSPSRGWTIKNCVFDSCPVPGHLDDNEGALSMNAETYKITGWVVENNTFQNISGRGGVHIYGMDSTVIRNNTFLDISTPYGAIFLKTGSSGNRNNEWYGNLIECANPGMALGTHCNANVDILKMHHNIIYGNVADKAIQITYDACFSCPSTFDSFFIYNNTIDFTSATTSERCLLNVHGNDESDEFMDNFFIFNNIIFYAGTGQHVVNMNRICTGTYSQFGDNWDTDYNLYVLRGTGEDFLTWRNNSGTDVGYTVAEWRTTGPSLNSTYAADSNSQSTTDTANMFIDRGADDFRLDVAGNHYSFLSTGGRGGSWETYIGALPPLDTTCPTGASDTPVDGDTIQATQVDIVADFTTDAAGDDIIVTLIGEIGDATPEDTLFVDTLAADSTGWTYNWSSLLEDSIYYWQIIATDTSCADTSAIRSFLVDSIPPVTPGTVLGIMGTSISGTDVK